MVGNTPNFTKIDVLRCFLKFDRNVSRQGLAKELELGEGTVRTILNILKSNGLLDSNKKGHFLSQKGRKTLGEIGSFVRDSKILQVKSIYPGLKKVGVKLSLNTGLKETYRLRDIAVKNGADGALIMKFSGRLYAPESDYRQDYDEIEKLFNFRSGDILIIAFSNEKRKAENGALAIAVELKNSLKKFISGL